MIPPPTTYKIISIAKLQVTIIRLLQVLLRQTTQNKDTTTTRAKLKNLEVLYEIKPETLPEYTMEER